MNKKGFTLVELLATLLILAIIVGIVVISTLNGLDKAKGKTEDVFVKTIEDALNVYLDSDAKKLNYSRQCSNSINKSHKLGIKVYVATITFNDVINSSYAPISASDMHNPANKNKSNYNCNVQAPVNIYRDEDFVYYYAINKSDFNCLNSTGMITNLPNNYSC